ncbi:MAG: hypothetical protein GY803_01355 [Chloroflexi bacterium]|nr:hypothetical protein [Chloroflexota bacterium]
MTGPRSWLNLRRSIPVNSSRLAQIAGMGKRGGELAQREGHMLGIDECRAIPPLPIAFGLKIAIVV